MGFGGSFMDFAHGWNRYVSGWGHEAAGAGRFWWNGGSILDPDRSPSVDDAESLQGRLEGGLEYDYGKELHASGASLMGDGVSGMGSAAWDGISGAGRALWDGVTGVFASDPSAGGAGGAGGAPSTGVDGGLPPGGAPEAFEMWAD